VVPERRPWGRSRRIEILKEIPLFSTCSRRELADVASLTAQVIVDGGTVLTREGQRGGLAYVIVDGMADVARHDQHLATLGPGDVVGELSLIDGQPRSATVVARTDLQVLEIDSRDLKALLDRAPHVMRKLLESLALRVRQADALEQHP